MWANLHDIFVEIFGRLDLGRRYASPEYTAYRQGRRIGDLKPDGRPLIWLHAVSLGEVNALRGLVEEIRRQTDGRVAIAISTMTEAGLPAARALNPEHAFIYPLDLSRFADEIVKRLQPKALVIFDGDFWFQMMRAVRVSGAPILIVNGKLSEKTARRHGWFPSYAREMFAGVALASAQSDMMAERFARFIPRERISVDGNLKLDLPGGVAVNSRSTRGDFAVVFGSIHPVELDFITSPITRFLADRPSARAIIVPRHPDKFTDGPAAKYFPCVNDSRLTWINKLGVLRELYQTADVAFVGGTFCEVGGHNIAEPALLGVPVIYGPDVHTQLPLHDLLQQYGASKQVASSDELYAAMIAMMDDAPLRETMAANAAKLRASSEGLTARIAAKILETASIVV
jgi:3-deoxy-D-manno-octulosonic-acid transferase